ncbi:hypothetical protein DENIS_1068 [Desulfonema ishimotonii]|uniref:CheW-like domain-containing protein n=1 Tax=Desulfonema ishimotonii TaxID=45657 RepID=A0A401FT44_9BACT|nr:hypothetical protein [Desulfonema ishimotonii]GBC60123.1 hypothetical protein DENIS_1068 [Desulfonema ishimotonii]
MTTEELDLLIFRIADIPFGMDMEQIACIREPEQAQLQADRVFRFDEKLRFPKKPVVYRAPMLLIPEDETPVSALLIEKPDEIVRIRTDAIRPLPRLIERALPGHPVWGVALIDQKLILLVDFYRILGQNTDP